VSPDAEAEQAFSDLIDDLGRHDPTTMSHSRRVGRLAHLIGVALGLTALELERLGKAAQLHDIGKLSVPRDVLTKGSELSGSEWALVRTHPTAGNRMVEPLRQWLGEWGAAAAEHHERFDGLGYPSGLQGSEISLAGRIVAVADAYDCIVSARSYKVAVSVDAARAELDAGSGTQFDPEIVERFLASTSGSR
jgi:HD-GYP domain-containing protein (c-di-GMP phosphodiesterase class II)